MAADAAIDAPLVSFEDYLAWPESEARVEVVDGRAIVNANPVSAHQYAAAELVVALRRACTSGLVVLCPSSDWVVRRDPLLVRQPDVVVVPRDQARAPRLGSAPLLAVEVLSPESRERDLVTKRREYAEAGLAWYWLVSLEVPQVLVLRNDDGAFVDHASARGDERLVVADPFGVELAPIDLAV